ncbi:hypothetical protein ACWDFL_16815 [Streptomyces bungoensis]
MSTPPPPHPAYPQTPTGPYQPGPGPHQPPAGPYAQVPGPYAQAPAPYPQGAGPKLAVNSRVQLANLVTALPDG